MKNLIQKITLFFVIALFFASCQPDKEETIQDFLIATNSFDNEILKKMLSDNFTYTKNNNQLDRTEYLNQMDSLKKLGSTGFYVGRDLIRH